MKVLRNLQSIEAYFYESDGVCRQLSFNFSDEQSADSAYEDIKNIPDRNFYVTHPDFTPPDVNNKRTGFTADIRNQPDKVRANLILDFLLQHFVLPSDLIVSCLNFKQDLSPNINQDPDCFKVRISTSARSLLSFTFKQFLKKSEELDVENILNDLAAPFAVNFFDRAEVLMHLDLLKEAKKRLIDNMESAVAQLKNGKADLAYVIRVTKGLEVLETRVTKLNKALSFSAIENAKQDENQRRLEISFGTFFSPEPEREQATTRRRAHSFGSFTS